MNHEENKMLRGNLRWALRSDTPIQIVAIYIFCSLGLPWALLTLSGEWPLFYRKEDFALIPGILCFGTIIFACAFKHTQWNKRPVLVEDQISSMIFSQKMRISILIAAIILSVINIAQGNSGFRYAGEGISETGGLSLYFYLVVPTTVRIFLIFHTFIYHNNGKIDKFERLLVTTALFCSINGNATAFMAVFSFIALQTNAKQYIFAAKFDVLTILRLTRLLSAISIFLFFAYLTGESIKRGENVLDVFDWVSGTSQGDVWSTDVIVNRAAPNYVSLVNALPLTLDWDRDSLGNFLGVINNFLYRLDALGLTNFGIDRGSAVSMMRFNYEWIDIFASNPREGTAPSLIPGFIFCFPPPINLIALFSYTLVVLATLQRLCLCIKKNLSILGKIILTYFTIPLFESPIDLLMVLDDGAIFFMGLWLIIRSTRIRSVPHHPNTSAHQPLYLAAQP